MFFGGSLGLKVAALAPFVRGDKASAPRPLMNSDPSRHPGKGRGEGALKMPHRPISSSKVRMGPPMVRGSTGLSFQGPTLGTCNFSKKSNLHTHTHTHTPKKHKVHPKEIG